MTATLTQPNTVLHELTTDVPPLPPGEVDAGDPPRRSRGEGLDEPHAPVLGAAGFNPRSPSPPLRRGAASDCCQTPHERNSGAGLASDPSRTPRAESASESASHPNPQSLAPIPSSLLNRLLALYTTHSNSFNDVCRELDVTMLELLDLLEHPDAARALERLAQASESRAKLLARVTNDSAVSALIDLMDTTDKPETRRKAAGAILRHGKPPAKSAKCGGDGLPLPLGEGRGEGHQLRASASHHATRSPVPDGSARLRRNAASGCCQTPLRSSAGLVSDIPGSHRAGGASESSKATILIKSRPRAA